MHCLPPGELTREAIPAVTARLSESALARLFPVKLSEMNPWDEPEPSKGALIQLRSGVRVVLIYGKVTHTAKVLVPDGADLTSSMNALFSEVALPADSILWRTDRIPAARPRRPAHPSVRKSARPSRAARKLAASGRK